MEEMTKNKLKRTWREIGTHQFRMEKWIALPSRRSRLMQEDKVKKKYFEKLRTGTD